MTPITAMMFRQTSIAQSKKGVIMYKIQLLNKISPAGLEKFSHENYECSTEMEHPDAILVRSTSMHQLELPPSVLTVARAGAGVNNIPCDTYAQQGVVVFNTPGANANAVKELVVLGLLLSSRKVLDSMQWLGSLKGQGNAVIDLVEQGKSKFSGPEIAGKTLGVIGLGAIGAQVANAASALGMTVYGYDPYISIEAAWGLSETVKQAKSLQEICQHSDYVTVHVPYNKDTKGMVDSAMIAAMKTGVRILNFSRADLVDHDDMLEALQERKVSYYVTDFAVDALLDHPYVVAFPHLGASTPESEDNCAKMAAAQIIDYLENGNIENAVNFPNASMANTGLPRICVVHQNIPSMVSQITTIVSTHSLNINNMINASKNELAYTLLDVSDKVSSDLFAAISAVTGVMRVRIV